MASLSDDLAALNKTTYASAQALRQYSRAVGWLDEGERVAFGLVAKPSNSHKGHVLDIGVGGGRTTPLLVDIAENYIGIDYVDELVVTASARFPDKVFLTMDARDLKFPDASFHLVNFSNNGVDSMSFDDRQEVFRQVFRVLLPTGYFIFSALNQHCKSYRYVPTTPKAVLKWAVSYPVSIVNRLKLRSCVKDEGNRSVRMLDAHFNGIVATFHSVTDQVSQLVGHGFEIECLVDTDGHIATMDTGVPSPETAYVHYVCRKPS
jgi:ubiquinone/menaquinone biosynthesis C-methylase UbiE